MNPKLTMVISVDEEKRLELLKLNLLALKKFNSDGLRYLQIILMNQRVDSEEVLRIIKNAGIRVELFQCDFEVVDGHPLWDIMSALRSIRPLMSGDWFSLMHSEFIYDPGTLLQTVEYLQKRRAPVVLGNLRRLGSRSTLGRFHEHSSCRTISGRVVKRIEGRLAGDKAPLLSKGEPQMVWEFYKKGNLYVDYPGQWVEDLFFAKINWLDDMRVFEHSNRLLFEDIFNLMGGLFQVLKRYGVQPWVDRIPMKHNRVLHLWHKKGYLHFTPALISFFQRDFKRWRNTRFLNSRELRALASFAKHRERFRINPLHEFRKGAGSSLNRYSRCVEQWLQRGGLAIAEQWKGVKGSA